MIDIHTHILPGLDDGAKDLGESLSFARMAVACGTTMMAATPHIREGYWENRRAGIEGALAELKTALKNEGIPLEVFLGAEIHLSSELMDGVQSEEYPSYSGHGRHILLELPNFYLNRQVEDYTFRLRTAGITPVLAHPERNPQCAENIDFLENLARMGVLMQVTAMSMLGGFGRAARRAADEMFNRGIVHVVATDAHNCRSRPPDLSEAFEKVTSRYGAEAAECLFVTNPRKVIEGQTLDADTAGTRMLTEQHAGSDWRGFLARLLG